MSTVTENDLQRLEGLINSKFEKVFEELTTIKIDMATLKESQNSLNTRIDETKKRIDEVKLRSCTYTEIATYKTKNNQFA